MEHLQGGTIALEHRYEIAQLAHTHDHVTLYHGVQDPFDRPVIIKVFRLPQDEASRQHLLGRLFEAAYLTSALRHDALTRAIDHGELQRGVPFIVCEGLAGESLAAKLEREGTLSMDQTLDLLERLGQALVYLHERGLAHGAISPDWVIIPEGQQVQDAVLDHALMGLTFSETLALHEDVLPTRSLLAMAPEMCRREHEEASASADQWALGALAYTCLVGVHPYAQDRADPIQAISRSSQQPPRPLRELGVDPSVGQLIERALATDPARRWPDLLSMLDALRSLRAASLDSPRQAITPTPADEIAAAPAPAQDSPQPDRVGTIAGLAILLLIVTNLAWCGLAMSRTSQPGSTPSAPHAQASTATASP